MPTVPISIRIFRNMSKRKLVKNGYKNHLLTEEQKQNNRGNQKSNAALNMSLAL